MAHILLCSSAVKVHDSRVQAYRKMDVTRERISPILEPREILLSFQTGFNLVNAAVVVVLLLFFGGGGNIVCFSCLCHKLIPIAFSCLSCRWIHSVFLVCFFVVAFLCGSSKEECKPWK